MNSEARIEELEAKVSELTALVERLAPTLRSTPAEPGVTPDIAPDVVEMPTSSRRGMLKLAGAAAVGAAAVAVAGQSSPAAAATDDPMLVGNSHTADTGDITSLIGNMQVLSASTNAGTILAGYGGALTGWDTSNDGANTRAGVLGLGGNFLFPAVTTTHGVTGYMFNGQGTGSGVYGRSNSNNVGVSAGVRAISNNGPAVQMDAVFTSAPTSGTWTRGALLPDTSGNLWLCVTSGSPGTWKKLAGPSTAGAFHALNPGRVYDSRSAAPFQGALIGGNNRTITVADLRDPATGAVTLADYVPAGATAVTANITIVSLSGAGFLTVNPGGVTSVGASTINWSAPGQVLANGVTLTLNSDRQLTVIAGGGGSTEFIVDISGYYL